MVTIEKELPLVLVTGATGFVGIHCVKELLDGPYRVRGTVRSTKNEKKIAPLLRLQDKNRLELYEIDLLDEGEKWKEAMKGVTFILHVASPVPIQPDDSTIETAIKGTTAVLEAAAVTPSIKKVVLTSSCTAINDGHSNKGNVFDETFWTDLTSTKIDAYARSKAMAEKAAWKLWKEIENENKFSLTVLNPTLIIGPLLSDAESGSATIVRRMMSFTTFLAAPPAYIGVVDVRDVAWAHVKALTTPSTDGQRILITNVPTLRFRQLTYWLQLEFGPHGYPVSGVEAPKWMLKAYAKLGIDKQAKATVHRCDGTLVFDNSKSLRLLKVKYRDPRESLYSQVHSMMELGMIRKTKKMKLKEKKQMVLVST